MFLRVFLLSSSLIACRHLTLEGGKEKTVHTPANVQITNASFGEEIADQGRSVVKLTFDSVAPSYDSEDEDEDKENEEETSTTVLCALTPGKVISCFYKISSSR